MTSIQLLGDSNNGGGIITEVSEGNVYINGKLVVLQGSRGTSHTGCPSSSIHCYPNWTTTASSASVFINNKAITLTGDVDTCGHIRIGGTSNVFIG